MDQIPHIDWPIRVTGTSYAFCEQDTSQELAANVAVLCSFQRGTRIEQPDFGITDPTFSQQPVDTSEIERQVGVYEPRAELDITVSQVAQTGEQTVTLAVAPATTTLDEEV